MTQERIEAIKDFVKRASAISGDLSEGSYLLGDEKEKIQVTITRQDGAWRRTRVSSTDGEIQVRPALFRLPDYIVFFWLTWGIFRYGENEPALDEAADRSALILTIKEYPTFSAKRFSKDYLSFLSKQQTEESRFRIQIMMNSLKELGFSFVRSRVGTMFTEAALHLLAAVLFIAGWVISVLVAGWATTLLLAYFPKYESQIVSSMIVVWGFLFVELLVQIYRIEKAWNLFIATPKETEHAS